ncbi:RIKEN cDNA 5430432M24, isoform CRA_d, partial [Mus musculus]
GAHQGLSLQSLHSSRGPTPAQRGTADGGGHTAFAQPKPHRLSLQDCLQVRTTRNKTRGFPGVLLIYLLLGSLKGGTKSGYGTGIDQKGSSGARYPAANFVPVSVFSPLPSGYVTAMPVDTLSPGAPATPALPFRLRTKVPGYLLPRPADGGARKPSAVERLEADKAKYVKSLRVANTRQEPVQPPLVRQPLFSPGPRGPVLTPSRRVLPCSGRRPQLDLDILSSLINLCDSPVSPSEASRTPGRPEGSAHKVPPATPPRPPPSTVAVRRVDVRPLPASPARPYPSPGTTTTSSPGRPPGLQRSKSDLSERFSRAAADLERFFNFCGLDPEEARGLGVAHLARASSDIVSLAGPSAGPCSSEGGCSRRSSATVEERSLDRVPYGVSVIERNARVIKWLYGLRQARDPPTTEG